MLSPYTWNVVCLVQSWWLWLIWCLGYLLSNLGEDARHAIYLWWQCWYLLRNWHLIRHPHQWPWWDQECIVGVGETSFPPAEIVDSMRGGVVSIRTEVEGTKHGLQFGEVRSSWNHNGEGWRSLLYKLWTSGRLCFCFSSHLLIAAKYLSHFLSGRATVWASKFQSKPMNGAVVLNSMSLEGSHGILSG